MTCDLTGASHAGWCAEQCCDVDDNIVVARLFYAAAFGVTLTVCLGSVAKAVSTTSRKKASMANQLAVHMSPIALAMLICASGMAPVQFGANGLRVNVLSLTAWSLTSWTMAELFAQFALYSAGVDVVPDHRHAVMMAAVSLLREGFAAAPRLWPGTRTWFACAACVALLLLVSVGAKVHTMSAYFASTAGEVDRLMTSMTLAAVILAMAACDVASLAYAAGAVSHSLLDSLLAVAITVRSLGLFSRLLVVMMYNDERTLTQHEVAEAGRRLQAERDAGLRRVFRYVCHELRVPLNSIALGLSVLADEARGHDADVLHGMQGATDIMLRVLCDLLDFSKMEQGVFQVQLHPVDVRSVIERAVDALRPQADAASVRLLPVVGADVPSLVYADGSRLVQACTNLLSNAIKFSPHDGTGVVTLSVEGAADDPGAPAATPWSAHSVGELALTGGSIKRVHISCRDNGVGMASTDLPKLFKPFAQLAAGVAHAGRGTGLGLAIVKEIVERHGGLVTVTSSAGIGSTFVITIPFRECTDTTPRWDEHSARVPPLAAAADAASAVVAAAGGLDPASVTTADARGGAAAVPATRRPSQAAAGERTSDAIGGEAEAAAPGAWAHNGTVAARVEGTRRRSAVQAASGLSSVPPLDEPRDVTATPNSEHDRVLRILVVDDETTNRRLLSRSLRARGRIFGGVTVEVTEAASGLEAVRLVEERGVGWFQVICMDNNMPHMSGVDTVRTLRDMGVAAVIIGCTGSALADDIATFLGAGLDDVVTKPITVDHLVGVIQQRRAGQSKSRAQLVAAPL